MLEELGKKKIKKQIADDMQAYKIDITGIQEHHSKGTWMIEIRSTDSEDTWTILHRVKW